MKIIFAIRNDYQTHFGGDVVQMLKTKEYLEKRDDVEIVICNSKEEILKHTDSDMMHIFNIQTVHESYEYLNLAKKLGIKTALSTIYWDLSYSTYVQKTFQLGIHNPIKFGQKAIFKLLKFVRRNTLDESYLSKGYMDKTTYLIENADVLLPNSDEELEQVARNFNLNYEELLAKTNVVPNAVDVDAVDYQPYLGELPKKFVLEIARIEVIKNQLNVIRALEDTPEIPIVFVGAEIEGSYLNHVKKVAEKRGNVHFLGRVPHEQLADIYGQAGVHILPSFRESPGLSSLEALEQNTNIVVSSKEYCPINYYRFNEFGSICDPFDIKSIKKSILQELNRERIIPASYFSNYSYEKAAEETFKGYLQVL